ncbi:hypothetical protein [Blastococcus atacamensis]|uniref:hypothetical protein n=1 Tax=Blastococcus atacamensis TaxID=2070508 RepID=UPI0012FFE51D|nr:hypothetical protein [Blastococcus atacamensis]
MAHGLADHLAEHATRGHPTEDSVAARFTSTDAARSPLVSPSSPVDALRGAGRGAH